MYEQNNTNGDNCRIFYDFQISKTKTRTSKNDIYYPLCNKLVEEIRMTNFILVSRKMIFK